MNPASSTRTNSFADFLLLGVKALVAGYDHLLFLFGPAIVTPISPPREDHHLLYHRPLHHLGRRDPEPGPDFPSRIVEPLIAASIVYVGVENCFVGDDPRTLAADVGFGLIHGFGFASVCASWRGRETKRDLRAIGVVQSGGGVGSIGCRCGACGIWKLRTGCFVSRGPACSFGCHAGGSGLRSACGFSLFDQVDPFVNLF